MVELYLEPHFLWHLAKLFLGATEDGSDHYAGHGTF
jgi:hypothetical protein